MAVRRSSVHTSYQSEGNEYYQDKREGKEAHKRSCQVPIKDTDVMWKC